MNKKQYPCSMSKSGSCEHGGNKSFNYGFMRGASSYCRHPREHRFLNDMNECPKDKQELNLQNVESVVK